MLGDFESLLLHSTPPTSMGQLLTLDITMHPGNILHQPTATGISLKVGPKQLYIVKNIERFVDAVVSGQTYPLQTNLTFDPEHHYFNEHDTSLIELIDDFYKTRRHLTPTSQVQVLTPTKAAFFYLYQILT